MAVWSLMTVSCGLAGSFLQLFASRVGVGVGEAALTPAAHSLISDYFPPRDRGAPLATYMIGLSVGAGAAFIGGGAIFDWIGSAPHVALPVFGELKPWQATFVLAGLPGLVLALFMAFVREPVRQERLQANQSSAAATPIPLRTAVGFILRENGRTYATIFVAFAGLALHAASLQLWLPAYFSRDFGWSTGRFGLTYGVIILVCATGGMVGGAQLASRLLARGHADALMRATVIMGVALTPVSIVCTLMPTPLLTLTLVAPIVVLSYGIMALAPGILQSITPNEMRGQVTAIFAFFNNLIGLMLGGTIVALLTDFGFKDHRAVGLSLTLTAALFLPASTMLLWRGLPAFRESLGRAHLWRPATAHVPS
jgi:MFS family permease